MSKPVSFALSPEDRVQRLRPATYLFRAASAYARSHVTGAGAEAVVEALYGDRDKATSYLVRAASNPATLVEPGWAGAIAQVSVSDLVAALTTLSAGAELIARGTRVDMTGVAHLTVPGRVVNAAAAGAWVREGSAIPVRSQSITSGAVLEPRKLAVIATMTSEIAASSNVEAVVRALLSESAALALDAAMFSANAEDGAHPAGLLYNVTPITPTAGGGMNALLADVKVLVAALAAAGGGRDAVIVAHPSQAATLSFMAGPHFTASVLPSSGVAVGTVVAVEASSLVSGFDAIPEFETSNVALLQMEDATPSDWGASMKSLYQADSFALKMILRAAWGMRAPHVAYLTGATW